MKYLDYLKDNQIITDTIRILFPDLFDTDTQSSVNEYFEILLPDKEMIVSDPLKVEKNVKFVLLKNFDKYKTLNDILKKNKIDYEFTKTLQSSLTGKDLTTKDLTDTTSTNTTNNLTTTTTPDLTTTNTPNLTTTNIRDLTDTSKPGVTTTTTDKLNMTSKDNKETVDTVSTKPFDGESYLETSQTKTTMKSLPGDGNSQDNTHTTVQSGTDETKYTGTDSSETKGSETTTQTGTTTLQDTGTVDVLSDTTHTGTDTTDHTSTTTDKETIIAEKIDNLLKIIELYSMNYIEIVSQDIDHVLSLRTWD